MIAVFLPTEASYWPTSYNFKDNTHSNFIMATFVYLFDGGG